MAWGTVLGTMIGRRIRSLMPFSPLRAADRLVGGGVNVAVRALVMSMLAFSIGALGVPFVSQQIAESKVIGSIDGVTPTPVKASMAQLRSAVISEGIPPCSRLRPRPADGTAEHQYGHAGAEHGRRSVLKIAGTAYQCGQNQTGTGFVVAPGRVVTNAHVVAGVTSRWWRCRRRRAARARRVL